MMWNFLLLLKPCIVSFIRFNFNNYIIYQTSV